MTDSGAARLFDLVTGKTVWSSSVRAVPVDMDPHSLLVRSQADTGTLTLLDAQTGRQRWTAPDHGLLGSSVT
ncbi:hypothetical protein [Fodinicola acaciae]|uniref:hypothetical protein n=1 Tax=Fodinicola acaciae TaxID=2681555 RepID=UPI0013D4C2C3|nr:hypothetical protein [Fodinicola acaciae]